MRFVLLAAVLAVVAAGMGLFRRFGWAELGLVVTLAFLVFALEAGAAFLGQFIKNYRAGGPRH